MRVRRVIRWAALVSASLLALVAAVALLALSSLDRPFVKRRIQALVQAKTGAEIRWTETRLRLLSGLHVDGLEVRSPKEYRDRAPSLLWVDALDLQWTTSSLRGNGPPLTSLRADGVAITMVRDENGRSSLDALAGGGTPTGQPAPSPEPARPLSHLLRDLLSASPVFATAELSRVSLSLFLPKTDYRLDGLQLRADYVREHDGWRVAAHLGDQLALTRSTGGAARVKLAAEARVSTGSAGLKLDADVLEQTLLPKATLKQLVHLEAEAVFDPQTKKVAIAVKNSLAADGAISVDAALELPDNGPTLVQHAEGELDAARALALVPAELVPVRVAGVTMGYRLENLLLDRQPRLLPGGGLVVVAEAARVDMEALAARGLKLTVDGKPDKQGGARLHAGLQLASLDAAGVAVRGAALTLQTRELHLDTHSPLETRGHVAVEGQTASVDARQKKTRLLVKDARWNVAARLQGKPPYNLDADIPAGELRLTQANRVLADGPAHLTLQATDVLPDAKEPVRSRAKVKLSAALGPVTVAMTADKAPEVVDYSLQAAATSLAPLRPFVAAYESAWDRTGVTLNSAGKVELAGARISHKSALTATDAAFQGSTVKELRVSVSSSGTAKKHAGELSLALTKGSFGGVAVPSAAARVGFDYDLGAPRASLSLSTEDGALKASLGFDRAKKAVRYDIDAKFAGLQTLAPFLAGSGLVEPAKLEVGFQAKGALLGVVQAVDDGVPRLVREPLKTMVVDGPVTLHVGHLHWQKGDRELRVPGVDWTLIFSGDAARRTLRSSVAMERLDYAAGDVEIAVHGLDDELETSIGGDLRLGVGSVDHKLTVKRIDQQVEAGYPIGNLTLDVHARRDADGVVHVSELRLANQAAGSTLALKGGFDVGGERRNMTLSGEVRQNVALLWTEPRELSGRGTAALTVVVSSGNFKLFHGVGALRLAGVDVRLPGYRIESLDGEIPLEGDFVFDARKGLQLFKAAPLNAYSELRFSDQNPLMHHQSFVTAARLITPLGTLAPLAGNLRIENNLFALNQLDTGVAGGRVTGECIVDRRPEDTLVHLHLRASHLASSHGEPFDGNAAVELSLKQRSLEGRAEILRIGKRHLEDLLDIHDPHHSDPAANKVRRALQLGYPDRVRLAFSHGFANAKLNFGGLARLITIDELRGIPMGPIIDKLLGPLFPDQQEEE